jgi:hypothetical protein
MSWRTVFRVVYRVLRIAEPLIRAWYRAVGLGNVVELRVPSRSTGRRRSVLLGVLRAGGELYVGHPNGESAWTRDLAAAGSGEIVWRTGPAVAFRPIRLPRGDERTAVIRATRQHPFPGDLIYRLARRHVLASGAYFRLAPLEEPTAERSGVATGPSR